MDNNHITQSRRKITSKLISLPSFEHRFQIQKHKNAFIMENGIGEDSMDLDKSEISPNSKNTYTIDTLLTYSNEQIKTSLLKMDSEISNKATKMFGYVLTYMNATNDNNITNKINQQIELAIKIIQLCIKKPELRDELYMQILKQSRGNPNPQSKLKVWELALIVSSTLPPSKEFVTIVCEYIHDILHDPEEEDVRDIVNRAWNNLKRTTKSGPRKSGLTVKEAESVLANTKLSVEVNFLDNNKVTIEYDITTTIKEAVETVANTINLKNFSTFSLYEVLTDDQDLNSEENAILEDHVILDDNRYIVDILANNEDRGLEYKFLFKKTMFREQDEHINEVPFVNLSYIQAQHDYLLGNYPVNRDDAAQICALQIFISHCVGLEEGDDVFKNAVETYITKRTLMTRPRMEWVHDVHRRYAALNKINSDVAKIQFLRIIRSLPYGNSAFFPVKRIEDPIGLLPSKLILGINKRGAHFFRPVPKEYLYTAELRDIMQYGASSHAVFFKIRVAGVLHVFQFETKQGEDIRMSLETHISDVMMKRYKKKTKEMSESKNKPKLERSLSQANFGNKYNLHVKKMKSKLREYENLISESKQDVNNLYYDLERKEEDLDSIRKNLMEIEESKAESIDGFFKIEKEVAQKRSQLNEYEKQTKVIKALQECAVNAAREKASIKSGYEIELEEDIKKINSEIDSEKFKIEDMEIKIVELNETYEKLKERLIEMKHSKDVEIQDHKIELENINAKRETIKEKEVKINELQEQLGDVTVMYNENLDEIEEIMKDQKELDKLMKFRAEIEMKEKETATIIQGQKTKIDYLETHYKEEATMRKKYFNQIEDLKGKIRVFCRIRPMLNSEKAKNQEIVISMPDEFTIAYPWKEEKELREHVYDKILTSDVTQELVFEETRHLVQSAVDGYNACVFAYGQTGTGKTFTIYGNDDNPGLTPRCILELFRVLEQGSSRYTAKVTCYMLELYMDNLVDLLHKGKKKQPKLEIKKDNEGMVTVQGSTVVEVTSAQQLKNTIERGLKKRHVSCTSMNIQSSRSHLIMSFIIESTNLQTQAVNRGKLSFIDLAGSERVKSSQVAGDGLKEAQSTNKSLSALGNVISALASKGNGHVPYRDHRLTMLMSDSLGGNAKTLMFVNLSPTDANIEETKNSLFYASRVRTIKNNPAKALHDKELLRLKKLGNYWRSLRKNDLDELLYEY